MIIETEKPYVAGCCECSHYYDFDDLFEMLAVINTACTRCAHGSYVMACELSAADEARVAQWERAHCGDDDEVNA